MAYEEGGVTETGEDRKNDDKMDVRSDIEGYIVHVDPSANSCIEEAF